MSTHACQVDTHEVSVESLAAIVTPPCHLRSRYPSTSPIGDLLQHYNSGAALLAGCASLGPWVYLNLVWTPYPSPRGGTEADLWSELDFTLRVSHRADMQSVISMVGYVAFGYPPWRSLFFQALGGRCYNHVTGGKLFLHQLHSIA